MNRSSNSHRSVARSLSILFDLLFAIALPSVCAYCGVLFASTNVGGWRTDLLVILFVWFEAAVFGLWMLFRRSLSTRAHAFFSGALGAGCVVAASLAAWIAIDLSVDDGAISKLITLALLVGSIPLLTAVAFGRAALRSWRDAAADARFSPLPRAIVSALTIVVVFFFLPITERVAIAHSIELADRGGEQAFDDATKFLRWVPWANSDKLAWEWEGRHREGRDATRIAELYQRVTGMTIDERLPGRGY